MPTIEHPTQTAVRPDLGITIDTEATLFVALELSLSNWVVVASAPGEDKASKHGVAACDGPGLLSLLKRLQERAKRRRGRPVEVVVMQEAGRDGFWVDRLLEAHDVCSLVVDPSSIALNRRSRRAKTDRIDAEAMLRTLMAWSRDERQVCAIVSVAPVFSPDRAFENSPLRCGLLLICMPWGAAGSSPPFPRRFGGGQWWSGLGNSS